MESIALGIFILCIVYAVIWSIVNDDARSIGEQTGFIRMRVPPPPRPEASAADSSLARASARRSRKARRRSSSRRSAGRTTTGDGTGGAPARR